MTNECCAQPQLIPVYIEMPYNCIRKHDEVNIIPPPTYEKLEELK